MCLSNVINIPTSNIGVNFILICLLIIYIMSFIHECIHAITYIAFGGKVKIGFKLMYAYTKETSKIALESHKFIIVLLAPLVVLTTISLLFGHWFGNLIFFFNLIGSTGDIVMTTIVLIYGRKGKIIDNDQGFTVIYE